MKASYSRRPFQNYINIGRVEHFLIPKLSMLMYWDSVDPEVPHQRVNLHKRS